MEGAAALTSACLLFSGAILLPAEKNTGILFMTLFWVPYGAYKYLQRVSGGRPAPPKVIPTAPVYTGPLPVSVEVDEDPR